MQLLLFQRNSPLSLYQHTSAKSFTDVRRASFGHRITNTHATSRYYSVLSVTVSGSVPLCLFCSRAEALATNACRYSHRKTYTCKKKLANSFILPAVLRIFLLLGELSPFHQNNDHKTHMQLFYMSFPAAFTFLWQISELSTGWNMFFHIFMVAKTHYWKRGKIKYW